MLHLIRANYVERLWKSSGIALVNLPSPLQHGWSEDGAIQWTEESFPDDVRRLLVNSEDNDYEYEGKPEVEESDSEDD